MAQRKSFTGRLVKSGEFTPRKKKKINNNKNLHHLNSLFSKVQYLPKVIWKQSCTHQMQRSLKKSWLLKLRRSEQENM